jgi:lysozyme family protein
METAIMSFARAIAYIYRPDVEGGLEEDPADPGGTTNRGLSQREYPELDVKTLSVEETTDIYHKDFWTPIHGDELPDSIAFALFDFAVNSGVPEAVHALQKALRISVDGIFGAETVHAAQIAPPKNLVRDLFSLRLVLMEKQPDYAHYGEGWRRRVIQTAIEAFQ